MLNDLTAFIRQYDLIHAGDTVICAVSGGADSTALLFALYLLREKLDFSLSAAHFNHGLRATESDRDEQFVRELCARYDIPLFVGRGEVVSGEKGLEAAAREARYAFFAQLHGKIATAHTADDNAETLVLHLLRGTGLKGLGAIAPQNGKIIRPMLGITRAQVLTFLDEYHLRHVLDSSNETDAFLRNRVRHHIMPLLRAENPKIAENLSATALSLRDDEAYLQQQARESASLRVDVLREMPTALRRRVLENFLEENGVREPQSRHIVAVESLVFSQKPSAQVQLPAGVTIERCYDTLRLAPSGGLTEISVSCPSETIIGSLGLKLICREATEIRNDATTFTVQPQGNILLRSRRTGDEMRLSGGTKSLKKLYIDRKIPASERDTIPVLVDALGVLAVYSIGVHADRAAKTLPAVQLIFEKL